jgi:hypothetical protein
MLTQPGELAPGKHFVLAIPERVAEVRGSYGSAAVLALLKAETEHPIAAGEPLRPQDLLLDVREAVQEAVPTTEKPYGSLIKLSFDMASKDLATEFKVCCEMVFSIYGRAAFEAIHNAIVGVSPWPVKAFGLRGDPPMVLHPESPRRKLFNLWAVEREQTKQRIAQIQTAMASDIALFARIGLAQSGMDALREAALLFELGDDADPGKQEAAFLGLPERVDPYPLKTDGLERLFQTLLEIADRKAQLDRVTQDADRKGLAVGLTALTSYHNPGAFKGAEAASLAARQVRNEQVAAFAVELAGIGLEMPIMFRLHATDLPEMAMRLQRDQSRQPVAQNAADFFRYLFPRREIWLQLKKVIDASREVGAELQESPDKVWAYPLLVHDYLDAVAIEPGTLAYAAAEDRLAEEGEPSLLQKASMAAGTGEMMAAVLGSTEVPPVAATIAIVSTLLGMASTAEEEYKKWRERAASWTHIDPGKSVAAGQGYAWSVFNVAMTAIDMAGLKGNAKLLKGAAKP